MKFNSKKGCLFVIVLWFLSCATEGTDVEQSESGSLIKSAKTYSAGILINESMFEYDSHNNLSKMLIKSNNGNNVVISYNYGADGRLDFFEEIITDAFGDVTTEINNINYEGDLISRICLDITYTDGPGSFDDPEVDKIEFEYDEVQNPILFSHFDAESSDQFTCNDVNDISNTEKLEYDDMGNMIRYENSAFFFGPTYFEYTYDNNNHPYRNIRPLAYAKLLGYSTVNNISSAKEYDADTDELIGSIDFDYEYNDSGFPIKLTRTYTSQGGSKTVLIYEYEYF